MLKQNQVSDTWSDYLQESDFSLIYAASMLPIRILLHHPYPVNQTVFASWSQLISTFHRITSLKPVSNMSSANFVWIEGVSSRIQLLLSTSMEQSGEGPISPM